MKYLLSLLLIFCACFTEPPTKVVTGADSRYIGTVLDSVVGLVNAEGRAYCSGVFYRNYIITAYHCVDDKLDGTVLIGRRDHLALNRFIDPIEWHVVDTNRDEDLAILGPDGVVEPHYSLPLSPRNPVIGDYVIVVGHPYGITYTVTPGRVTAGIQIRDTGEPRTWFTATPAIAPGNSGGPILNRYGEIFGISAFTYGYIGANKISGYVHLVAIRETVGEL